MELVPGCCLLDRKDKKIKATTVSKIPGLSVLSQLFIQLLLKLMGTKRYSVDQLCLSLSLSFQSNCPIMPPPTLHPQEDAVPALITLKSALTLLLLMASRQAEITWFLGLPTEKKEKQRHTDEQNGYPTGNHTLSHGQKQ